MPYVEVPDPDTKKVTPKPPYGRRHNPEDLPGEADRWLCEWPERPNDLKVAMDSTCHYCRIARAVQVKTRAARITMVHGRQAEEMGVSNGAVVPAVDALRWSAEDGDDVMVLRMLDQLEGKTP